ncbi:IDEAL domain-containing protein [Neobacillus sp. OS1-32]|uniref:IDEAL domain-containing protein n=1 Tax=Neobacillus paridis TaxID=2803862 RepID=A0ABS1TM17_9BACI|nr:MULTISPECIES: IDEAL domain-containing protein [Neobacillus]MBL4952345.1 IDEAL domain-containing protein [Neobacillus paridis]WML32121.1 IDEAL domain-containing protein [Neobacillus sp. OS1-32]
MKEKSYGELMKIAAMKRNQKKDNFVQNLYIEILLSEIQLTSERERILQKIDAAIDNRDKKSFLQLTDQLKEINKRFGT